MKIMEYLIQQGSDVNMADLEGWTPFNTAIQYGHLEAVKYLIEIGAKQNRDDGRTPLYAAARFGHFDIVKYFISNGADVNNENDNGKVSLHGAAFNGNMKIMEYLIEQGSDVDKADQKGWTPFNAAIQFGHLEVIKYLIDKGAKQNRYEGRTPLYAAARFGHFDIVEYFISNGADVNNENYNGKVSLHGAAFNGNMKIMEYLIEQGSDVDKADQKGWTPFNVAIQFGHLEVIKYLIDKGAKQNRYEGMTPLYIAAQVGHLDIVDYFVSNGVDVNEENDDGRIPLHGATFKGNINIMRYLVKRGSEVNKADSKGGKPFNAANQRGHLEAVKYLLDKGADQNRFRGKTPLHAAAQFGHLDIVKFFISNGADVNEENDNGIIPLHGAAVSGNMKIMEYLTEEGSEVNKGDPKGWTAFNAAIQYGHPEAVKYLIDKGAKQNRCGGMTPLYAAAQFGHLDIVKFFISNGADVNEENDNGKIPLHSAAINGNMDIMKYLIQQGSDVIKSNLKGWTSFNAALQGGHLEAVKYLIEIGAKQNRYEGMTPLYAAAQFSHSDIVKFFISNGADVNEVNDNGIIPLHGAAVSGNMKIMKYLIQQGSDINKGDTKGWTAFNAAIQYGHLEAVKYLLDKGAKQNGYDGMTPLYIATQAGHLDIVQYLISNGSDVNGVDDEGTIAIHAAVRKGNIEIAEYLIQRGSDVNKAGNNGLTPLNAAIIEGHLEVVKFLMAKRAHCLSYKGMTPLYIATQYGHIDVVKFLVSKGSNVNEGTESKKSPLHAACYNGNIDVVEYLLFNNADVNHQDQDGWTPLQAAQQEGHLQIIKFLSVRGANMKDIDGITSIQASPNIDHSTRIKGISSTDDVCAEIATGDPQHKDHQTAMTLEFVTASVTDPETHSCATHTEQSKLHVHNMYDGNAFIHAGIEEERCAELPVRAPSAGAHTVEDGASEKDNLFSGAKSKSPDEYEHGLSQDGIDTVQHFRARKQYNRVNDTSHPDSHYLDEWASIQAVRQEGHLKVIEYPSVCDAHGKDKGGITSTQASPNMNRSSRIEGISSTDFVCTQIATGDPQHKDHQTAITLEIVTATVTDPETHSGSTHTEQSKLHVHNMNDGNAGIEEERYDELHVRALSTGAHEAKVDANQKPNPFSGAQSKSPDKSEHGSSQDDIVKVQNCMTKTKYNQTDDTSRLVFFGPHKWQYNGFRTPFLQTQRTQSNSMTSSQVSEDTESRLHLLAKEIGQTRKPPNLINKRNDCVSHGASSELNRTLRSEPFQIGHQVIYDKQHLSHIGATSGNTGWKTLSEHQKASTDRPPTILLFLQTFLQMILALAILLAGCPVHVGADGITEEVTLLAGSRGVVPFYFPMSGNDTFSGLPYYLLQFESQLRPFCVNGKIDIGGFKSPTQSQRFKTKITDLDTSPSVNLIIDNVETIDQDSYLFTTILHHSQEYVQYETVKKNCFVQIPHGPAKCFITTSENHEFTYEVHCRASSGSTATTIACYHNGQKLHSGNGIEDDGQVTRGIFFIPFNNRFACCSHEVTSFISAATCNDFEWPPRKPRADSTTGITSIAPNSVNSTSDMPVSISTNPTTHIKYCADSGAGRKFIHIFLWYMPCLFIGVLNFVK
ncbi:uncharacterized protein LOC129259644 [Lytechinus pictus]|uniref:uncharacterized protein LOC129259644 n=1 Tax=Lytechinus pictus TaxID=7653 RepID=UPI0030B9BDDC